MPALNGFALPNYTDIPNLIFDHWIQQLPGDHFKVYAFIAYKTLKLTIHSNGYGSVSNESISTGVALSPDEVEQITEDLLSEGLILKRKFFDKKTGGTLYTLDIEDNIEQEDRHAVHS